MQLRKKGYREGSYRGKGGQITWRAGNNSGRYQGPSMPSQNQIDLRRDLNAMDVDRGREGDRICYWCEKWSHMARNCYEKNKAQVVEMP